MCLLLLLLLLLCNSETSITVIRGLYKCLFGPLKVPIYLPLRYDTIIIRHIIEVVVGCRRCSRGRHVVRVMFASGRRRRR